MQEYLEMWKRYADFKGTTNIRGYWMAFLFNVIVSFVIGLITGIIPALAFISYVYSLAALIPGLAISVRRLNDAGKKWTWLFISFVPLVGFIILIIMLCKPSVAKQEEPVFVEA